MSTNEVRIGRQDAAGRRAMAEYILRWPFSQQKMRDHAKSRTVIYRFKMHPVLKRNFEVFPVLDRQPSPPTFPMRASTLSDTTAGTAT